MSSLELRTLTTDYVRLAFKIEQEVFSRTQDRKANRFSPEDLVFLLKHGTVMVAEQETTGSNKGIMGIAESIRLQDLLNENVRADLIKLPDTSYLRRILISYLTILQGAYGHGVLAERMGLPNREGYHYAHRFGVAIPGQRYGSRFFPQWVEILVGPNESMFMFVEAAGSPNGRPNIPSLRMCLANGAVIDGVEDNVYEPHIPYFRLVHDRKIQTNPNAQGIVIVRLDGNYIAKIKNLLGMDYVCTAYIKPSPQQIELIFRQRV